MSPASAKAERRSSRDLGAFDRADGGGERVGEFVDRGDGDIETQPLDVVLDLGQRAMRGAADVARRRAENAAGFAGRAAPTMRSISQTRRQKRCVCEGALHAGFGPD